MIRLTRMIAAGAIAASTTITCVLASGTTALAADQVPFKGSYAGVLDPPHGPPPETLSGAGSATHLGASSNSGYGVVTGPATCPGGFAARNDEVLTSTDKGDQIYFTSTSQDCPVSPGIFQAVGTFTVTGGTGRFVDARGGGNLTGRPDFNAGTFEFSFTGTISRPRND